MEQLELFSTSELTSSQEERPARTCRSPESVAEWQRAATPAQASPSSSYALPESFDPDMCYGRTWRVVSTERTPPTSCDSSPRLMNAGILAHGECWTRSMCEWTGWIVPSRRDGGVCGLSDVLDGMQPRLLKYFLSPTALRGILRRADARGKALPTLLAAAIAWMLGWWETLGVEVSTPSQTEQSPAEE